MMRNDEEVVINLYIEIKMYNTFVLKFQNVYVIFIYNIKIENAL